MVDEWNIHVHLPDWGESFSPWRTHAFNTSPLTVTATGLDGTGYVRSIAACARGHWTLDAGQVGGKPLMVRSAPPVTAQRARAVAGAQDPLVDAEEELIKKFFTA
jgi:hypothetical protein